jgi:ribosomal protein S18 acetylase RimI-like enzyme
VESSFQRLLGDDEALVVMGEIDGYPFGFAVALIEGILPQAAGEKIGSIRLIYVEPEAREISLGEEMRDHLVDRLRRRGISRFDAHVLPGHRLAKNFFEAGGFAARSIIMHHDDERE